MFAFISFALAVLFSYANYKLYKKTGSLNICFSEFKRSYRRFLMNDQTFEDFITMASLIFWVLLLAFIPYVNAFVSIMVFAMNHSITWFLKPKELLKITFSRSDNGTTV